MIDIKKIIIESSSDYYINQNNEFFDHFEKYKDVMSELKIQKVVKLCKSDLKSLIQHINERNSYIDEINTNYINPNEIEKFNFLKNRLGYENMSDAYSIIAENDSFLLNDIKSQIINLRSNTLNFDVENIQTLIDSFGKCIQYLSINDLEFLSKMVENNELFSLLTLEPILITKIGITIILRNWVYLHISDNFNHILKESYASNNIIVEKISNNINKTLLFNNKYVINKFDLSWNQKKFLIGSISFTGLLSSYYLGMLSRNKTIISFNNGFNGMLGTMFINFRNITGRLAYEVAYSMSHLSNQALLGVIIPKKELFQEILKKYKK